MYLSRLILDPQHRGVRRELGDVVALHKTIMSAFPDAAGPQARAALGVLWRLELGPRSAAPCLLVQSAVAPDWSRLPAGYLAPVDGASVKEMDAPLAAIRPGMQLRFRLAANATRKIDTKSAADGARRNGRRVPLRGDDAVIAWLVRHAERAGIELAADPGGTGLALIVRPLGDLVGGSAGDGLRGPRVTIRGFLLEGLLTVMDAELLRWAIAEGIGPAKAYGFGLLSVAPVGP